VILPGSYANGFAPRDNQPLYPELWRGCVFAAAPCLGPSGLTLRDNSGFGNHGTLTNMDAGTDWATSQGSWALDFDGVNDYVAFSNRAVSEASSGISVSAWVNHSLTSAVGYVVRKGREVLSSSELALGLIAVSGSYYAYYRELPSSGRSHRGTVAVPSGTWTHISATRVWGATTPNIYVNGALQSLVLVDNAAGTYGASPTTQILRIGSSSNDTEWFSGMISDVAIHKRLLSANEIRLLASRRGIAYEMTPRRRSRAAVITSSGFSALRPSILRGSR